MRKDRRLGHGSRACTCDKPLFSEPPIICTLVISSSIAFLSRSEAWKYSQCIKYHHISHFRIRLIATRTERCVEKAPRVLWSAGTPGNMQTKARNMRHKNKSCFTLIPHAKQKHPWKVIFFYQEQNRNATHYVKALRIVTSNFARSLSISLLCIS